jgi:hypothetical protein
MLHSSDKLCRKWLCVNLTLNAQCPHATRRAIKSANIPILNLAFQSVYTNDQPPNQQRDSEQRVEPIAIYAVLDIVATTACEDIVLPTLASIYTQHDVVEESYNVGSVCPFASAVENAYFITAVRFEPGAIVGLAGPR